MSRKQREKEQSAQPTRSTTIIAHFETFKELVVLLQKDDMHAHKRTKIKTARCVQSLN